MKINLKSIYILTIVLLTVLAYSNIFNNQFVWDDKDFVLNWDAPKDIKNIPSLIKGSLPPEHVGVYRPLRSVYYTISYKLWGINPVGYHLQAILVHLACTILTYLIIQKLSNIHIAFLSSLLFGLHPIHTNAITFITSSFDQIGIVWFLASFYTYILAREQEDKKQSVNLTTMSILFAALAFFSYELTLTLPGILILYEIYFVDKSDSIKRIVQHSIIKKIKDYAPYFSLAIIYISIRFFIIKIVGRSTYLGESFYLTMLAMSKTLIKEILLLIAPINLSIHHVISKGILAFSNTQTHKPTILSQSIFNADVIFSITIILLLLVSMIKLYKNHKILSFCIAWFFITMAPVLNLIPLQTLLDEDFLYLPSLGFCLLLANGIYWVYNSNKKTEEKETPNKKQSQTRPHKIIAIVLTLVLIISYSSITLSRNKDWKNDISLWQKTVKQNPQSAMGHNNLGLAYWSASKIDLAIHEFNVSLVVDPYYARANNNLGNIYIDQGEIELAIVEYLSAIEKYPTYLEAITNLGNAYLEKGEIELAIEEYKKVISINKYHPNAYANLGNAYTKKGEIELAIESYKNSLTINPTDIKSYNNLGNLYAIKGDSDLAIDIFRRIISIYPTYPKSYKNLGIIYAQKGQKELAIKELETALKLDPTDKTVENILTSLKQSND